MPTTDTFQSIYRRRTAPAISMRTQSPRDVARAPSSRPRSWRLSPYSIRHWSRLHMQPVDCIVRLAYVSRWCSISTRRNASCIRGRDAVAVHRPPSDIRRSTLTCVLRKQKTVSGSRILPRAAHYSSQLSLLPSVGRKMSNGQSAVMRCGWRVNAWGHSIRG